MDTEIIKDYGQTVSPEVYIHALQGHQYIPQSDECIMRVLSAYIKKLNIGGFVLDVGCGPGRLTQQIAFEHLDTTVLGVDVSESFIEYAERRHLRERQVYGTEKLKYLCQDFCVTDAGFVDQKYDVILMQGVMHHVHGDDRGIFKMRCSQLLRPNGILIIGDEFIAEYKNEEERRVNVCKFYLHIIGEAIKGGFRELAFEEAKNLIDDVLSGEPGAGYANEEILNMIYESAKLNNGWFYNKGFIPNQNTKDNLIPRLRQMCSALASDSSQQNFNRGDFKVSTSEFIKEMEYEDFVLHSKYEFGPVEELGGMGVMVFKKK